MTKTFFCLSTIFLFAISCKKLELQQNNQQQLQLNTTQQITGSGQPLYAGFQKIFTAKDATTVFDCAASSDNGVVMCGMTTSFNTNSKGEALLMKVDANGNSIWTKTFVYSESYEDDLFRIKRTADGGYVVLGASMGEQNAKILLLKVDANGNVVLNKRYDMGELFILNTDQIDVTQTSNGGFAFTCTHQGGVLVAKLSASGDVSWSNFYHVNTYAAPTSIIEDNDQLVIAGRCTNESSSSAEAFLLKISGSTGVQSLVKVYTSDYRISFSQIEKRDNYYYINGIAYNNIYPYPTPYQSYFKMDVNGNVIQQKILPTIYEGFAKASLTKDGGFIANEANGYDGTRMYKLSSQFNLEWSKEFPHSNNLEQVNSAPAEFTEGGYFSAVVFTEIANGFHNSNFLAIKTDNVGNTGACQTNNFFPVLLDINITEIPSVYSFDPAVFPVSNEQAAVTNVKYNERILCKDQ